MARNLGNVVQNHFGGGYITEATGLNFPPNGATDTENCVFTQKMSVTRRLGYNFESEYVGKQVTIANHVLTEFLWQGVAGQGTINFVVIQKGPTVFFYNVGTNAPLSAGLFTTTINLESRKISGAPSTATQNCQFASGYGYLFIAHPYCDPIYVQYNSSTGGFTVTSAVLQQRDFQGNDDTLTSQNRPIAVSVEHLYNLYNQGWANQSSSIYSYIAAFDSGVGSNPSNSDIWWLFKNSSGVFDPHDTVGNISVGNTAAPKGSFILDCFNQDRSAAVVALAATLGATGQGSSAPGLPKVTSSYWRPACVAFFAGRAWYAGVNFANFTNQIYYSRIIQNNGHISQCYQDNDPTADDLGDADLLPSDGGVLVEPEIGQIFKMIPVAYSLIIFASNGVWAISGSTGSGFNATDFSVSKISNIGMLSANSFVDVDGVPVWWNQDGIFTLNSGGAGPSGSATPGVSSMTDGTIKTFYESIPAQSKLNAKGTYNRSTYSIYWLFTYDAPADITSRYLYDGVLIYNTHLKNFCKWTIPTNAPAQISGLVTVLGQGTTYQLDEVVDHLSIPVTTQLGEEIDVTIATAVQESSVTKFLVQYLISGLSYISWAESNDSSYFDFGSIDFDSFATSGYSLHGQGSAKFQSPYLTLYIADQSPSQIQVNVAWDFATDPSTGKITATQLLASEGGRADYRSFKRKFRGTGKALQITFSSVSGWPFEVAGWAQEISTNSGP